MALNRERILNELGDVMNQLQSADCGCMENLFTPTPTHGMGGQCCGHAGCHSAQPLQPTQTMPMYVPTNAAQVLGNCDPTKLYNETYSYLSENLVKPVVQEVYQDLKSLTPENTMANNPLAQQIIGANAHSGSTPGNGGMPMGQGNMGIMSSPGMGVVEQMGGMLQNQMMEGCGGQGGMGDMGGKGQIQTKGSAGDQPISETAQRFGQGMVDMMLNDSKNNPAPLKPGLPNMPGMPDMSGIPALANEMMGSGAMPQMGGGVPPMVSEVSPMSGGLTPAGSGAPQMASPAMSHNTNNGQPQNAANLAHMSQMANMAQIPQNMLKNMQPHQSGNQYGINEFHKMFPEIQQGGDLGFDPMTLAMQMNPDNQNLAPVDAMHIMAHGLPTTAPQNSNTPQSNTSAPKTYANAPQTYGNFSTPNYNNYNCNNYNNESNNDIRKPISNKDSKISPSVMKARNGLMPQDQVNYNTWTHHQHHQQAASQGQTQPGQQHNNQWQQQAVHSEPYSQQNSLQQQYPAVVPAAFNQGSVSNKPQQNMVKEPIFPVDTSNIRYNPLGQPYEEIPRHMIQQENFPLPQTLSPLPPPVKPMQFGTVKSTISKTAMVGLKPVGKQPSKSQLQQIYKQYRGSNSYPNIGGVLMPYKEMNHPLTPLENVGDAANIKEITIKMEQIDAGQIGDAPTMSKKPKEDDDIITPLQLGRRRNGLQDVVITQYSNNRSPKWSFHGDTHTRPHYTTYRFKPKN